MTNRQWALPLVLLVCSVSMLRAQGAPDFFPLDEVRPGLKGVGRTVFQGDKIEEFQVEILGVLKNANAPKRTLVIARLAGGPLEKTGVIAGMSGSPVYIDGKLLGAVAVSFAFAKEPVAGITPIQEMLEVVPEPVTPSASVSVSGLEPRIVGRSGASRLIPNEEETIPAALVRRMSPLMEDASTAGLRLPLRLGGFAPEVIQAYSPLFRQMGFEPMAGGTLAGGPQATAVSKDLLPGSMVSLLLLQGDLNLNIDCTVTYRQGDKLYACGHRVLWAGPSRIPFATSQVLVTVPSLSSSFKLGAPGEIMGTIRHDRLSGIYGLVGEMTPLVPVRVTVKSTLNKTVNYDFEMVQEPYVSPLLLTMVLPSTLTTTERSLGQSTLELQGKIKLRTGEAIEIRDVVSSDVSTANSLGSAFATPLTYLLTSYPEAPIQGIELNVAVQNQRRMATIEQVWSTHSEVSPGDKIEITALLRGPSGEAFTEKLPVEIPASVNDKTLSLVVGSGSAVDAVQNRLTAIASPPRNLAHLVKALNRMRRNNRLYALLLAPQRSLSLQGEEYPSPPPSLLQTFLVDQAAASGATFSGVSAIGDLETKPLTYAVRGQKVLVLRVAEPGD